MSVKMVWKTMADMACKAKEGGRSAINCQPQRRLNVPGLGGNLFERLRISGSGLMPGLLVGLMVMMAPVALHAQVSLPYITPTEFYEGERVTFTITLSAEDAMLWNTDKPNRTVGFGGTANVGVDYLQIGQITAQTAAQNGDNYTLPVTFQANTDSDNTEGDETITIKIQGGYSNVTYDYYDFGTVTITLKDGARPAASDRVTVTPTSLTLTELGSPADVEKTYTVVLNTDPGADVTITLSNIVTGVVEVDTDSTMGGAQRTLTFTAGGDGSGSGAGNGNWAVAQTVTVRALNDGDAAGESFNLTHAATAVGSTAPYHGIAIDPVAVTVMDAGHGVVVSESSVSVAENDETVTYTLVLKSRPSGNVVIAATSGATTTATVSPPTLTFTTGDWSTPQTVTITGKGAGSTSISHAVTSATADTTNYPTSTMIPSVAVSVSSTATSGVTLTETSGSTEVSEDGSTTIDTYDLVLAAAPTHAVMVTVSAGSGVQVNKAGGSYASSQTVTFTPSGTGLWSTAQTITVRGVNDNVDNPGGHRTVTLSHTASSADPAYNTLSVDSVAVRVTDDEATTVTLFGAAGNITEGQTKTVTLTLGRGLVDGESLTVPLTFGGAAAQGIDYTLEGTVATGVQYANLNNANATVEFTGPQTGTTATTATITLMATADSTVESTAETVIIGLGTLTNTGLTGAGGVDETDILGDFSISDPPSTANVTVSASSLALTELGAPTDVTKTYTLVLATDPTADVTITVTNGDATAVAVDTDAGTSGDQNTLIFTQGNTGTWGTAQTVTVRALNDGDGANESFTLTHAATAASGPYNNITIDPVAITTTDAGHGVVLSQASVSVAENEATATYTLVLKSQPSGNVVISVTSDATSHATVDTGTLTFTSANWNAPQTVTVTGKGVGSTSIRHAVSTSADTTYPTSTTIPSVAVSVTATATPAGITLTETGDDTVVSEDGTTTDSYDLVLDAEPTHDVILTISAGSGVQVSTDGGTNYATSPTVTFTSGTWNVAQTITVKGVDDGVDNAGGSRAVTLRHTTRSADPSYNNIPVDPVEVRVADVIVAGVDISQAEEDPIVVKEGDSDTYTLVLTSVPQTNVVISVTSRDPAIAEVVPKRLTFTPQNARTPQTVTVRGVADDRDTPSPRTTVIEHVVVTTNDPDYRDFSIDSITVMVEDEAKLGEAARATSAGLTRFGRTVGQQAVAALRDRVGADRTRGFVSRLAGETLPRIAGTREASDLPDQEVWSAPRHHRSENDRGPGDGFGRENGADVTRALSEEDTLRGTSFTLNTLKEDGTSLAFWGKGSIAGFRGTAEGIFLDGDVRNVMVGTDRLKDARLMGIMAMGSRGDITYRFGDDKGRLETALTALVPYGRRDLRNGLSFWGAVGVGWGSLTVTPEGTDPVEGPLDWRMAAGGIEGRLSSVDLLPAADLGWHTDALWTRTRSEPSEALPALGGTTTRVRLGMDATWPETPALKGLVAPHAGVGIRYDGGDAETGFGLEIDGGVTWRDPDSPLSILVEGRTLAVHEEGAFRDWGVTFGLSWDPRPDTREGFSATFGYDLGNGTSGEDALLGAETYPEQIETDGGTRWRSEVAFGVSQGGDMVGSSYGGLSGTSDDVDEARVGYRIEPDTPHAEKLRIDVWADPVAEDEDTSTGAGLTWQW